MPDSSVYQDAECSAYAIVFFNPMRILCVFIDFSLIMTQQGTGGRWT